MPFIEPRMPYAAPHPMKGNGVRPPASVDMWGMPIDNDLDRTGHAPVANDASFDRQLHGGYSEARHSLGGDVGRTMLLNDSPVLPFAMPYPQNFPQQFANDPYGYARPSLGPFPGFGGWRAPVLEPRHVLLSDVLPTPHDTYRYPTGYDELLPEPPTKDDTLQALAEWYVDRVIEALVVPGNFRPGVGGASEAIWGLAGREKDAWERVGRAPPDFANPWGRMGMTSAPMEPIRRTRTRQPENEPHDPWNVMWCNTPVRSSTLVHFVKDILARMSVESTSVIAASWFVSGIGLHDGDGIKGAELRSFLHTVRCTEIEAVEKRVAMLGLLLAGKWLDDNSFLNKSWTEVTAIPVDQVHKMELCALQDLHWALYIPLPSWVDHVNKLYSACLFQGEKTTSQRIIHDTLDDMVSEARDAELNDTKSLFTPTLAGSRRSSQDMAADHALSRDWGAFARTYAYHETGQEIDADMELSRDVAALVDDEMDPTDDEDDEEWDLDYDGATRWLPSMSEMRRSLSASQSPTPQPVPAHRLDGASDYRYNYSDDNLDRAFGLATPDFQPQVSQAFRDAGHRSSHCGSKHCTKCDHSIPQQAYLTPPGSSPMPMHPEARSSMELEPGIAVVRPPLSNEYRSDQPSRSVYRPTPHEQQMKHASKRDKALPRHSAYGCAPYMFLRAST